MAERCVAHLKRRPPRRNRRSADRVAATGQAPDTSTYLRTWSVLAASSIDAPEPPVNRRDAAAAAVAGAAMDAAFTSELVRSRWLGDGHLDAVSMPDLEVLRREVARVKTDYQACRYAQTAAQLPDLLTTLDAATSALTGDELLAAEALAADAYHVAASLQLNLGSEGPAWMTADASMRAAHRSEDPIAMASSARIVTHVLIDARRHRDAETFVRLMAEKLSGTWSREPANDALAVYGSLLLRGAIAAAKAGNAASAEELLDEAQDAGRRLGADCNLRWTAFGPTNVRLHQVSVATVLGNVGMLSTAPEASSSRRSPSPSGEPASSSTSPLHICNGASTSGRITRCAQLSGSLHRS